MPSKRAKLTADKARERITSLEESIQLREQKLEQLRSRISRTSSPEEKLVAAEARLERKLNLEREQVQKLRRLLSRRAEDAAQESSEYFSSEEIDDLHRSFEEVRQDLTQVKARLESAELPRDLPSRLNSFEERISRREEVSSELYSQILNLQNALDQERQTVRRLSRRIREQDQSLDALREAVEDSVVATVDLAERLDDLEEKISGEAESAPGAEHGLEERLERLTERLVELEAMTADAGGASSGDDQEILLEALDDFDNRLETLEERVAAIPAPEPSASAEFESRLRLLEQKLEQALEMAAKSEQTEATAVGGKAAPEPPTTPAAEFVAPAPAPRSNWTPVRFSSRGSRGKLVAKWEPANFSSGGPHSGRILETS